MANALKNLKRFPEANRQLRQVIRAAPAGDLRQSAFIEIADICLLEKKPEDARRFIAKVMEVVAPRQNWREIHEAYCLRAECRFRKAVDFLLAFRADQPENKPLCFDAEVEAAKILCGIGDLDAARRIVERLHADFPNPNVYRVQQLVVVTLLARLVEKRYDECAALLLRESRRPHEPVTARGKEAVEAGILLELAGRTDEAKKVWRDADRARRLLTLSLKEDPTLNWPAMLAMRDLGMRLDTGHGRSTGRA